MGHYDTKNKEKTNKMERKNLNICEQGMFD